MLVFVQKSWALVFWILVIGWIGMTESSKKSDEDLDCLFGLLNCTLEVEGLLPYVNNFPVAKSAPLKDHCRVWSEASPCFHEKLRRSECSRPSSNSSQKIKVGLRLLDSLAKYVCKENFDKVERNFRCLSDDSLGQSISRSCEDVPLNATNACDLIPEATECTSKAVASKCGEEAEQIAREICPWFLPGAFQVIFGKKCPSPTNEQECGEALTTCVAPAIERYAGKNEAEVFEEVRDTPIRTHCSDWNTAIGCVRQVVYSDVCDDVRPNIDHLDELLELYDWFSNYICVEHVDKVDRNFRCLVSLELFSEFATTCKDEIGENNLCVINENKERIAQCAYGVITGRCGAEATSVVRGTSEKIFEYLEMGAKDYCETSKRARQLAVLKSILRRL